jgi:tetratricopeptide (TPR) repeat protein
MTLFKYTPALIEPEILLKTLMGRKEELRTINRILKSASSGRSLSHAIIIGPKGIGKTHLLRIIYHCIKGDIKIKELNDYREDFVPLISPEEEYVDRLDKFILLILRYLKNSGAENIPSGLEEVLKPAAFGDKEKEIAVSYIKLFKNRTKKLLLLLVDNINEIIENFSEEDQSRLREILMTSDSVLLIGTAPTIFDSIMEHDKPLFNFFETIWLGDLTFDDTKTLLNKYAEIEDRNDLIKLFAESESKIRAIYNLAGGNPRLILSLYQIIAEDDITSVEKTFFRIVDELNPYFRERMRDITKQQQQIIDVMARDRKLLTPTEIASKCLMPVNVVNSQMKRLEKLGYIEKAPQKRAKRVLYEIREKLFSIWRQMRIEAGRKRLGFLVSFYQIWYTQEELMTQLLNTYTNIKEMFDLGKTEIEPLIDKLWYIKKAVGLPEHASCWLQANLAHFKGDYESATRNLMEYLTTEPADHDAWNNLGFAYTRLGKYEKAIEAYKKAVETKPDEHDAWNNLGYDYSALKKYDEAIEAYKKAVEIKPDKHESWYNLGNSYFELKKYDVAIEAYKKAVEIKPDKHEAWYNMGNIYSELKRYDEAIEAYKKAVEIKPDKHEAWYNLGYTYSELEKYDYALKAYKKAIEIKSDFHQAWSDLGFQYIFLGKFDEAIIAFRKAIEILPSNDLAWTGLGSLYVMLFDLQKPEEDKTISLQYLKSSLGCISHITEFKWLFNTFAFFLKQCITEKKIDMVKIVLDEIEKVGEKALLEFLSPFSTLIKYLETKDRDIIERLKREDRVIVEEMLKLLEGKAQQEIKQKKTRGKTKRKLET